MYIVLLIFHHFPTFTIIHNGKERKNIWRKKSGMCQEGRTGVADICGDTRQKKGLFPGPLKINRDRKYLRMQHIGADKENAL